MSSTIITITLPDKFTLSIPPAITANTGTATGIPIGVDGGTVITVTITAVTAVADTLIVSFNVDVATGEDALGAVTFTFVTTNPVPIPNTNTYVTIPVGGGYCAKSINEAAGGNILIGQKIFFTGISAGATTITIAGDTGSGSPTAGEIFSTAVNPAKGTAIFDTSVMTKTGVYFIDDNTAATPHSQLLVGTPTMDLDIEVDTTSVSKVAMGTPFIIDFTNNLDPADIVTLKVRNPNGDMMILNPTDGTPFKNQRVDVIGGLTINTDIQWKIGTYTIWIKTTKERAEGLDMSSNEKTLELIKGVINVEADKTTVPELEIVSLTVTGVLGNTIRITSTGAPADTLFPAGLDDNKPTPQTGAGFTDTIDADGKRTYAVEFLDTGAYTITVEDLTAGGPLATVDITVTEMKVAFDIPTTVYLGEKLEIKGTSNTGDWVAIAFDDVIPAGYNQLIIDSNGAISKDIATGPTSPSSALKAPGSVHVEGIYKLGVATRSDISLRCK